MESFIHTYNCRPVTPALSLSKRITSYLKKFPLIPIILFISHAASAQDYRWWNNKHNWDGVTHWSKYIILSPGYLGPNALPVPEVEDAILPEMASLELAVDAHFSEGDQTQDLYTEFYTPLFTKRAGLRINMIPVEHFKMDTATRDMRRVRDEDGEGYSSGDVYVSTFIQLVKDKEGCPDISVTANLKTASGGKLSAARHTDSPGYYFSLSAGKNFQTGLPCMDIIRIYGMAGFYSWQTFRDEYYQDDAILYGLGCNLRFNKLDLKNTLGGYYGYIGNRDQPVVYTLSLETRYESGMNFKIMYRHGIKDFMYDTFRFSCVFDLKGVTRFMLEQN